MLAALRKAAAMLILAVVLLAIAGVLGATGHITSQMSYDLVLFVLAIAGLSAGQILGDITTSNAELWPHLIIALAVLSVTVALAVYDVFTSGQLQGIFVLVLGPSAFVVGSVTVQAASSRTVRLELVADPDPEPSAFVKGMTAGMATIPPPPEPDPQPPVPA